MTCLETRQLKNPTNAVGSKCEMIGQGVIYLSMKQTSMIYEVFCNNLFEPDYWKHIFCDMCGSLEIHDN